MKILSPRSTFEDHTRCCCCCIGRLQNQKQHNTTQYPRFTTSRQFNNAALSKIPKPYRLSSRRKSARSSPVPFRRFDWNLFWNPSVCVFECERVRALVLSAEEQVIQPPNHTNAFDIICETANRRRRFSFKRRRPSRCRRRELQ